MNSGSVNIDEGAYYQNWHGFQIARGTAHSDTIYGTGDNDHSVPKTLCIFILVQMDMCIQEQEQIS